MFEGEYHHMVEISQLISLPSLYSIKIFIVRSTTYHTIRNLVLYRVVLDNECSKWKMLQ